MTSPTSTAIGPGHVFSLSDGVKTLKFITCDQGGHANPGAGWNQAPMPTSAMKISQGNQGYEDFELPFTSIEAKDWSGGMNAENFESDTTKYRDGRRCDTTRGDVICGPMEIRVADALAVAELNKLDFDEIKDDDTVSVLYGSFTPAANITVNKVLMLNDYEDVIRFKVAIHADNTGIPGSELESGEIVNFNGPNMDLISITLNAPLNLTASTTYWIRFECYNFTNTGRIIVYDTSASRRERHFVRNEEGENIVRITGTGPGYTTVYTDQTLSFSLLGTSSPIESLKLFKYRRCDYCIANVDGGGAPSLYRKGYRGAASSNAADKTKLNTDQSLTGANLAGCVVLIIDGPGSEEAQPWRRIISNTTTGTNDVITVDKPWKTTHTIATSWVIVGSVQWVQIIGHGLTGSVTGIEIVKDYVVFAQGSAINIRKMREYNNAGAWTVVYADDGTNKADLLLAIANTEGTLKLWKALADANEIKSADVMAWGTGHTFGDAINPGDDTSRINKLVAYGDPLIPYVLKEDSIGSIQNDIYAAIPIGEMPAFRSEYNGTAAMLYGVYLYFNMGEKLEQFYDRRLTDVGPDRGEGLPENRQGVIKKLLPFPGRYYVMLYTDGNTPSILCNSGYGFHEIWRATRVIADGTAESTGQAAPFAYRVVDEPSVRVNDMLIEQIPGGDVGRLWFDVDGEIAFIPIAINPRKASQYQYADLCQLETAWIYGNLKDVVKYWHSVKLHTENLSGAATTNQIIKVEYKVDDDTTWTHAGYIDTSPIEELDLSSSYNVTGYRIKLRFTLHTADAGITPRIVAAVVKGVIRVEPKKGWHATVLIDPDKDLREKPDTQTGMMTQLDTWANSDLTPAPLTLRHAVDYYDNKKVFIDPASLKILRLELEPTKGQSRREISQVASFSMYEV